MHHILFLSILLVFRSSVQGGSITFTPNDIDLEKNTSISVNAKIIDSTNSCRLYVFNYAHGESAIAYQEDRQVIVPLANKTICGSDGDFTIEVTSQEVGSLLVGASLLHNQSYELLDGFFKVTVIHVYWLDVLQKIVGWLYFLAWSISFYPQVISNYRRKSVVGLSFDYTFLNVVGFVCYSTFNVSLFWIPAIQRQYHYLHPRGKIPVEPNDVAFSLHALVITSISMVQCFIYERGTQTVSKLGKVVITIISIVMVTALFVAIGNVISWLMFVSIFSYVKLFITSVKYFPQIWLNFSRKSTDGWPLGNVLADFSGGVLSFLQMIFIASNNDDWTIIYGNMTKLCLGLAAILFDTVLFVQHCIYKKGSSEILYNSL